MEDNITKNLSENDAVTPVNPSAEQEPQVVEAVATEEQYEDLVPNDRRIYGWLALFLWVGLGLGSILSLVSVCRDFDELYLDSLQQFCGYGYGIGIVVVAVYAIIAFYRQQPDAVLAAKVYTALLFADGLINFILVYSLDTHGLAPKGDVLMQCIKPIIWGAFWFGFLCKSSRVEQVIPPETRKNSLISPILGIVVLCLGAFFYTNLYSITQEGMSSYDQARQEELSAPPVGEVQEFQTDGLSYDSRIDLAIANTTLPMVNGSMVTTKIERKDDAVVFTYKDLGADKDLLSSADISAFVKTERKEVTAQMKENVDDFLRDVAEGGYALKYIYFDQNDKYITEITFSNAVIKKAIGE